jgi:ceramide glucosyltransferase
VIFIAAIAAAYQLFALIACIAFRRRLLATNDQPLATSILKPVRGLDPGLREALESHRALEGEFELLCGVSDPADARSIPGAIVSTTDAPNRKVGTLVDLARVARYPILIVNDADIRVPRDYLAHVTGPLGDPKVGLVTCLYRARGETAAGKLEALGVATDFAPSALVARMVGVDEFAFGSTLAFRRADLARIGGFEAIAPYLADDYQLGHKLHALGLKCVLTNVVVETRLGGSWREMWTHQVRWARTIRVSKFWGYVGLPVTFATVWAVVAAALGDWRIAAGVLAARYIMGLAAIGAVEDRAALALSWAIPLRDLFGAAVWFAGLFGNTVEWRGRRLTLDRSGRILTD